jgi:hypothetical protein
MRALVPAAVLALLAFTGCATPDDPKSNDPILNDPRDPVSHLREVAAGKFEQWQREATKTPSNVTYTRVEYDTKAFWVVDVHLGFGNAYKTIAVYAPAKDGSFRRCLLADSNAAGHLAVTVDAKAGVLELREQANSTIKGEVVLSCNLKTIGTPFSAGVVP